MERSKSASKVAQEQSAVSAFRFRPQTLASVLLSLTCLPGQLIAKPQTLSGANHELPLVAGLAVNTQDSDNYIQVQRAEGIIANFDPKVHLYVLEHANGSEKNFSAIDESQLKEIAKFLADTNFYLVIAEQTKGFSFDTREGSKYEGKEALRVFLGQKLFETGSFAQAKENIAGVDYKSASLFVLSLDPGKGNRGWFLSTSEALEKLGVNDETDWNKGQKYGLIAPTLFLSHKYAQGIKNTVQKIEGLANQRRAEMNSVRTSAEAGYANAASALNEYKLQLNKANVDFPGRSGDLFQPTDLANLDKDLATAKSALDTNNFKSCTATASNLSALAQNRKSALVEYAASEERINSLANTVKTASSDPLIFLSLAGLNKLSTSVDSTAKLWKEGQASYLNNLRSSEEISRNLTAEMRDGERRYGNDGDAINELSNRIERAKKSEFYNAGSEQIEEAEKLVGTLHDKWQKKDHSYPNLLTATSEKVYQALTTIEAAEAENASKEKRNALFGIFGLLGLLGAAGFGAVARQRAKNEKFEAEAALARLNEAMTLKESALEEMQILKAAALMDEGKMIRFAQGSESAKLAKEARSALDNLWLFQVVAKEEIFIQAKKLIESGSKFSNKNYVKALEVLKNKPVTFSAENRDKIKTAFGEIKSNIEVLTTPIEQLTDFSRSLQEIDQEYIRLSQLANDSLKKILNSKNQTLSLSATIEQKLIDLPKDAALAEIAAPLCAILHESLGSATSLSKTDPVNCFAKLEEINKVISLAVRYSELHSFVAESRNEVSSNFSASALEQLFNEPEISIAPHFKTIKNTLNAIANGTLKLEDEALGSKLSKVEDSCESIKNIVVETKKAIGEVTSTIKSANTALSKAQERTTDCEQTLNNIRTHYVKEFLLLDDQEQVEETSDLTIENNISETTKVLSQAKDAIKAASSSWENGQVIFALKEAKEALAYIKFANSRLVEIENRDKQLKDAEREIIARENELSRSIQTLQEKLNDFRVTEDLRTHFSNNLQPSLTKISELKEKQKTNPLASLELINDVALESVQLNKAIIDKIREFDALCKRVEKELEAVNAAKELVTDSENDNLPDTAAADSAQEALTTLITEYNKLAQKLLKAQTNQKAIDWETLGSELTETLSKISRHQKKLEDEVETGQKLFDDLKAARKAVIAARNWSGKYQITIDGDPGKEELARAEEAYRSGRLKAARELIDTAYHAANSAISNAEERVSGEARRRRSIAASSSYHTTRRSNDNDLLHDIASAAIIFNTLGGGHNRSSDSGSSGSGLGDVLGGIADSVSSISSDIASGGSSVDF